MPSGPVLLIEASTSSLAGVCSYTSEASTFRLAGVCSYTPEASTTSLACVCIYTPEARTISLACVCSYTYGLRNPLLQVRGSGTTPMSRTQYMPFCPMLPSEASTIRLVACVRSYTHGF